MLPTMYTRIVEVIQEWLCLWDSDLIGQAAGTRSLIQEVPLKRNLLEFMMRSSTSCGVCTLFRHKDMKSRRIFLCRTTSRTS